MSHFFCFCKGRQAPVFLACFFSPMILRKRLKSMEGYWTGLHSHPCSSRPCRYIRVPASLLFERFPSIITARKRASKNRYLPPLRKLWPCGTQIRPLSHSVGHRYVPCPTVSDTKKGGLSRLLEWIGVIPDTASVLQAHHRCCPLHGCSGRWALKGPD